MDGAAALPLECISPRKAEIFQLRIVSATMANVWWKVLCRACDTVQQVRERLVQGTGVKNVTRLYHNGATLPEKRTLGSLCITEATILATGRTQSVVFGNRSREKVINDAAVSMTPRGGCCDNVDAATNVAEHSGQRPPVARGRGTFGKQAVKSFRDGLSIRQERAARLTLAGATESVRPQSPRWPAHIPCRKGVKTPNVPLDMDLFTPAPAPA